MTERVELLELLCRDGVLFSTPDAPIVNATGETMAWMLDTQRVSLTARGSELAARCLLSELARFESVQLATYGVTAIPLLQACVTLGGGRYSGLVIRKEAKAYGAGKLIEGPLDRSQPVVIIDDSISSGSSMVKAIERLEAEGLRVEGAVTLVRFGFSSGWIHMVARGLRMASVFDVFTDLVPRVEPARIPLANPSMVLPHCVRGTDAFAAGLSPSALARQVIEHHLAGRAIPAAPASGVDPAPPSGGAAARGPAASREYSAPPSGGAAARGPAASRESPSGGEYDAAGGAWVSIRSKANLHERHARNGFWVLPGEPTPTVAEAVIIAALRTAPYVTAEQLASSALAVTCFGALEPCTVGDLDNDRYGILVRSRERTDRMGGALPRMPGMWREWAQFDHARTHNAQLAPFEAYDLYRHTVTKSVDAGVEWQPTGMPIGAPPPWDREAVAGRIAARAYAYVRAVVERRPVGGEPLPPDLAAIGGLYVSVFRDGHVVGCMGGALQALESDVERLTRAALVDPRFAASSAEAGGGKLAVTVSMLFEPHYFGAVEPAAMATQVVPHRHALMVSQRTRSAVLLPFVTLQHSLTRDQLVVELIDKAGITRAPYHFTRYETRTWFADGERVVALPWGLPPGAPPTTIADALERLVPLLRAYTAAHQRPDGTFDGLYRPFVDQVLLDHERPRQVFGAWAELCVQREFGGDATVATASLAAALVIADRGDLALNEAAMLVLALCAADPAHARLANAVEQITSAVDAAGLVAGSRYERHYVLPQIALALAVAARTSELPELARARARAAAERAFARSTRQFEHDASWAGVGWIPKAAAALYELDPSAATATRAFEAIEWALPYQQRAGGFINAEQVDAPGCTTAVYLEGIAAALRLARAVGDAARTERYTAAALAALQFLDGITYQDRDTALLPAPARALGGLHLSRTAGDVRTDFVHHALLALAELRA